MGVPATRWHPLRVPVVGEDDITGTVCVDAGPKGFQRLSFPLQPFRALLSLPNPPEPSEPFRTVSLESYGLGRNQAKLNDLNKAK